MLFLIEASENKNKTFFFLIEVYDPPLPNTLQLPPKLRTPTLDT